MKIPQLCHMVAKDHISMHTILFKLETALCFSGITVLNNVVTFPLPIN